MLASFLWERSDTNVLPVFEFSNTEEKTVFGYLQCFVQTSKHLHHLDLKQQTKAFQALPLLSSQFKWHCCHLQPLKSPHAQR